jgi:transposase
METDKSVFEKLLDLGDFYEIDRIEQSQVEVISTKNREKYGKKSYSQVEIYLKLSKEHPIPIGYKLHSYNTKRWRHLDVFEHRCYLVCDIPLLLEESTGKLKNLELSFAKPYSGFTLKMEFGILQWIQEMNNINGVGRLLGEYPQRIQKIFDNHVNKQPDVIQAGKKMAIDETNRKKGHVYMTLFVDLDGEKPKIVDIEDGKGKDTIAKFVQKCSNVAEIEQLSMDMSLSFISGAKEYLPNVPITFDKFHVVRLLNDHLDTLETKYNFENIVEAKNLLHENMYKQDSIPELKAFLAFFADWTIDKLLSNKIAKSIFNHFDGIAQVVTSQITNGVLEGINSKIQVIKRTARGFRSFDNFKQRVFFAFSSFNTITGKII